MENESAYFLKLTKRLQGLIGFSGRDKSREAVPD
jgi:hypothetical protein